MQAPSSLYPHSRDIQLTGDGWKTTLCVARLPSPKRGRFMLIHGNPSHLDDWSRTAPALASLGEVVAYDQVGFGRSARIDGAPASLDVCADVAIALADSLGWSRFSVVGQSHGGMVAHTLAARYPARAQAVALLGTGGTPTHPSYRLLSLPFVRAALAVVGGPIYRWRALRPIARAATAATITTSYAPDEIPAGLLGAQLQYFARRPDVLETMAALSLGDPCAQVARQCPALKAPVLFVHGKDDRLVPIAFARRLFELTRQHTQTRFVAMDGGHMLHYCRATEVNATLTPWLATHSVD